MVAEDLEDELELVVFADDVLLLFVGGASHLVAWREWEAGRSSEKESVLGVDSVLFILFGAANHF